MSAPIIAPIKLKEYDVKQSRYPQVGKLPIRSVLLAASGGGKTVLIQNMIMDIYKGLFERVYIFSPSIHVDHTWISVKEYLKNAINLKEDEPEMYYDHYDPEALEQIIETQKKIIEFQKSKKEKTFYHYELCFFFLGLGRGLFQNSHWLGQGTKVG